MREIDFVLETPWLGCEARETFEFEDDVEEVDFNGYWEEA